MDFSSNKQKRLGKKTCFSIFTYMLILLALVSTGLQAGSITEKFNFAQNEIGFKKIGEFDLPVMRDWLYTAEIGKPMIPYMSFQVLVPPTAEVTEVKVLSFKKVEIEGKYYIHPSQPPVPISYKGEIPFVPPDEATYNSTEEYPARLVDFVPTGSKSGYRISGVEVYPLHYVPKERRLFLYTELVLEIIYEEGKVAPQPLTESQKRLFGAEVRSLIINKKDLKRFEPPTKLIDQGNEIDYLIITSNTLASNFQPLVEWKTKKGWNTKIRNTNWINSSYSGRDLQEKIRNYIRTCWADSGLKFVLLAGDSSIVPPRLARAYVNTEIGNIPCDLYYADLQWSWDGNNDNIFGDTWTTGSGDTVDLYYDVYIGRASVETASEISNFLNKLFTYEKNPNTDYIKRILLPWGVLWSGYDSKQSQDSIAKYTPAGWTDRYINDTRVVNEVRDSLNNGFQFCHLVGHGNDVGVYWTSTGPAMYHTGHPGTQTNVNKYLIANSIACYPGNFEYSDCLAESMVNVQNCAVAVIMNSRYGWGTPPNIGPSELLDFQFYYFFFNYDTFRIGITHAESKEFYRNSALNQQVWRWCYYELNLFGCPEMPMWRDIPLAMTLAFDDTINTGSQTFSVTVTDPSDAPVVNALVCLWKGNEVYVRGYTNASGIVNFTINPTTIGQMFVTVSAFNHYPKEDTCYVIEQNEDVGVTAIITPTGNIDSSAVSSIIPQATIHNYSISDTLSFPVIFDIYDNGWNLVWSDTQQILDLGPNRDTTINFAALGIELARGTYNTKCTTALVGDINPSNDWQDSSFTVIVHDVGVVDIVTPTGLIKKNSGVTPQVTVRNFGSVRDSFDVILTIGATYVDTVFTTLDPNIQTTLSFNPWTATTIGTFSVRCTTALIGDLVTVNDTLSDSVIVYDDDVGVVAILEPVGPTDSTATIVPRCSVYNYGSSPATFSVTFRILEAGYSNTQTVTALAPNTGTAIPFAPWLVGPRGNYTTRCSTGMSPDTNALNDTLSGSFTIRVHDVGVTEILAPIGVVALNSSITPQAVVRNFGTETDTFDVSLVVLTSPSSSWTETGIILDSGAVDTVSFAPNWTASPLGTFEVRCSTSLTNDLVVANNLKIDTVIVTDFDVGVVAILAPVDTLDSTATLVPQCSVYNYGSSAVTFPVTFRILEAGYTATETVIGLPPNTGTTVSFAPWTVGPRGSYTTRCSTELMPDFNPVNDTLSGSFVIRVHDVGVTEILAPVDTVILNHAYNPKAVVTNFGSVRETFNVSLVILPTIPPPSSFTQSVTLPAGETDTVDFNLALWVATPLGTHQVRCSTDLANDLVPNNNLTIDSVTVSDADVGVTAIVFPTGNVDSTATITPLVSFYNYGTNPASFPAILTFTGPANYVDTQIVNLAGNSGLTIPFDPWTVGPRGTYQVKCTTALAFDTTAVNDTMSGFFSIIVHDVATIEIIAPKGVMRLNRSVTAQAVVRNQGTQAESVDVSMIVLTPVPTTWTVTIDNLGAGVTDTVDFGLWTATPLGTHQVRCSTDLANDLVPSNNLIIDSVTVSDADVGVTEILYPTGTIDSTVSLIPEAVVFNYGSQAISFPVIMRILPPATYVNIQWVNNLPPNTADTVQFAPWTIGPRGTYTVRCSTALNIDTSAVNDTVSRQFEIIVHDVGTTEILAPKGIVPLGSPVTPRAVVRNFGTETDTFDVSLTVLTVPPSSWTQTGIVLNPGEVDTVSFAPNWTAGPVGIFQVRCSTSMVQDSVLANNLQIDTVQVVAFDVGVNAIVAPVGTIDSSTTPTVVPQASITNYATIPVSFPAIFRITRGAYIWADTQTINLNAGQTATVSFDTWTVGQTGIYTTRCTTGLIGDVDPTNNHTDSTFRVVTPGGDVGVTALILNPSGPNVDSGTTIQISARVKNFGTEVSTFQVKTKIGTFYLDSLPTPLTLNPGDSATVSFSNWVAVRRGQHIVRCSTELDGDIDHSNDRQTRNITVLVRDVRTYSILAPTGNIDSTANPITPQAIVENSGNVLVDSFPVIFTITGPATWTNTQMVRNLPAGQQRTVDFAPWTIGPVGAYTTACSTAYALDMNPSNDRRTSQFWIQRVDISVDSIVSPLGVVDSNSVVPVQAWVSNQGTSNKTFSAIFRIGTFYTDTVIITLNSLADSLVTFDTWRISQPKGIYPVQCTTVIANDANPNNNQDTGSVQVRVKDVAIDSIISPSPVIPPGIMNPIARVINNGSDSLDFYVYFRIRSASGTVYFDSAYVPLLAPDSSYDATFPAWDAVPGIYIARCSLAIAGDMVRSNDTLSITFNVATRDVGVSRIVFPGRRTLLGPIQPRVVVKNYSSTIESFWTWFSITDTASGSNVYFDSAFCADLGPWMERILDFPVWTANLGGYRLVSYTALVGDDSTANDTVTAYCRVDSIILPKWAQKMDMPLGPRGRPVKRGGCITFGGNNLLFALKGAGTNEFYSYNITSDTWVTLETIPYALNKKKKVKGGSAICYDGNNTIFALKGNNTLEFWAYSIPYSTWIQLTDVPAGSKRAKGGSGLAFVPGPTGGLIYCLKGSKTFEFYAYSIATNTWIFLRNAPAGYRGKPFDKGSCLTYDPSTNQIFALKGYENEFFAYDIIADSWTIKASLPIYGFAGQKRAKEGAALVADGSGLIYAFKGNNSQEFWVYHIAGDWWEQVDPIPIGPNNRKVNQGGALAYVPSIGKIYALKGNRTREFWAYDPNALSLLNSLNDLNSSSGTMETETRPLELINFKVTPNPNKGNFILKYNVDKIRPITVKLYNALGERVFEQTKQVTNKSGTITIHTEKLAIGIYIMRIEFDGLRYSEKVLIQR
ncbi:MAG: C25 family cysteine peptidase [candidate division WOR-3 bacterium]